MIERKTGMTRRKILSLAAGVTASLALSKAWGASASQQDPSSLIHRPIPSSGERIPAVGLGTWRAFDRQPADNEYARLTSVVSALFEAGGRVIDTSPMYGRAEETVGEILSRDNHAGDPFIATKVWTQGREAGIAQMEKSFRLLGTDVIDLMQIHNLVDWQTHIGTLNEWKRAGRIRYTGITHYSSYAYEDVERVLRDHPFDFLQINYSPDNRDAEKRLLPLCRDKGIAVIINSPFGGGDLIRRLQSQPLPAWSAEAGATSWAQLVLKFILSSPAVTCVIPGTGNPKYMADNMQAGTGRTLNAHQCHQLINIISAL